MLFDVIITNAHVAAVNTFSEFYVVFSLYCYCCTVEFYLNCISGFSFDKLNVVDILSMSTLCL